MATCCLTSALWFYFAFTQNLFNQFVEINLLIKRYQTFISHRAYVLSMEKLSTILTLVVWGRCKWFTVVTQELCAKCFLDLYFCFQHAVCTRYGHFAHHKQQLFLIYYYLSVPQVSTSWKSYCYSENRSNLNLGLSGERPPWEQWDMSWG